MTVAGASAGLAGCLDALGSAAGGDYTCTQLADESTERVEAEETPVPLSFERPAVMEQTETNRGSSGGGRVAFAQRWTEQSTRQERDLLQNELRLSVVYGPGGPGRGPRYVYPDFRTVSVVGKRSFEGTPVGVVEVEGDGRRSWLEVVLPRTRDGQRVYDTFEVEANAAIQGRGEEVEAALGEDGDQTCSEALRAVTTGVVDSVPELSPPGTETSLSLSPSSASAGDGPAEFTLQAEGIEWIDLTIGSRRSEYRFLGTVQVGDGPTPVTVRRSDDPSEIVSVPEDATLNVVTSTGGVAAGSYPVRALAPGSDGLVEATATLSVE